jgi:hypothetical protein
MLNKKYLESKQQGVIWKYRKWKRKIIGRRLNGEKRRMIR